MRINYARILSRAAANTVGRRHKVRAFTNSIKWAFIWRGVFAIARALRGL